LVRFLVQRGNDNNMQNAKVEVVETDTRVGLPAHSDSRRLRFLYLVLRVVMNWLSVFPSGKLLRCMLLQCRRRGRDGNSGEESRIEQREGDLSNSNCIVPNPVARVKIQS
jgi:hypothetical protein